MKKSEGRYMWVRAISREEAIALAPEIFRVGEEANNRAEADMLLANLAIKHQGYIPERSALHFIAADRDDDVYCFVWARREIWVYDGGWCPDPDKVEKVEWRKG